MSIKQIQISRVLEEATRTLYSSGKKPTLNQIFNIVSRHFSRYRAGQPLPLPGDIAVPRSTSNVNSFNTALLHIATNVDVLYETMLEQVDDMLIMSTSLQAQLDRLKQKRRRIETTIDDYLLSLYDTDGYYYSISDTFSDLDLTDLNLTSARVDVVSGNVSIPSVNSYTRQVPRQNITEPNLIVTANGALVPYTITSSFSGAVEDDLENTAWIIEVDLPAQADVMVRADIGLGGANGASISRVELMPYGVAPTQIMVQTSSPAASADALVVFGSRIPYTTEKVVFIDNLRTVAGVRLTMRKTAVDFTHQSEGATRYRYLFGAKTLSFLEQVYDTSARFISSPLSFHEDIGEDMVMDAVVLSVNEQKPLGTNITYYIATDEGETATDISNFDWRRVTPVTTNAPGSIIRFEGAQLITRNINSLGEAPDLELYAIDASTADPGRRNPSQVIIPGSDVYRICNFDDPALLSSMRLEEGVNSTRIAYIPTMVNAAVGSVEYWATALQSDDLRVKYGRINTGNGFFYGGDLGEANVSAFVETELHCDEARPTFLAEASKPDLSAQQWHVRLFLNGQEIGNMPVGVHRAMLPWTLREGKNTIIMLVNIPADTSIGTFNLMGDFNLFDYGTVKLDTWDYIDFFDLENNQAGTPKTFSLFEGQLVTRRPTTDNYRLRYSVPTGRGPSALRFRADFERDQGNPNVTPRLSDYRLRFSFGSDL